MDEKIEKEMKEKIDGSCGRSGPPSPEIIAANRKIGFLMNILMGISVSIILSTFSVWNSGHFTVPTWILSLAISMVLALLIGFFLPVRVTKEKLTGKIKNPLLKFLCGNLVTNIFYVLIISSINCTLMITLAKHNMDLNHVPLSVPRPSVLQALPKSLLESYIVSYVVTLILEPIFLTIAKKKYGPKTNR